MMAIFKRELRAYFLSPIAYVFMTGFFILGGLFFILNLINGIGNFSWILSSMKLVLLFMIPALTMKLISEDRKTRVDQLLLTSPVSTTSIAIGKFLAASAVFAITLVITLAYPAMLQKLAHPSIGEIINAYLGFLFLGMAFISICLFTSSLTDSQVTAFIIGFTAILSLWIIGFVESMVSSTFLVKTLDWISLIKRYDEIAGGVLRMSPLIYYLSVIVFFVFLTIRSLEKRRWSEG